MVGYTSIYGGVYLLRGRNHMCQIVENFPNKSVKLPSQHVFELSVGECHYMVQLLLSEGF